MQFYCPSRTYAAILVLHYLVFFHCLLPTYLPVFLDKIIRTPPKEECIGAYLNRKFVISRKSCIDSIRGISKIGRLFIRKNTQNICQKNNQTLIEVEKIYVNGEIVLLEIPLVCSSKKKIKLLICLVI